MKQVMNVEFLADDMVNIEYGGKKNSIEKKQLLNSFYDDIFKKGYIVGNDIHRQDVGEFIYYQFYYFDGTNSQNVWFQVPKEDLSSIHFIDQVISEIEKEQQLPDIIFDDESKNQ
ncbi:MAG: hypothetical protein HFH08_05660 [Bacilli bacterium]|nr:hypothetical protein [Bacilli bacterium]